jgi:GT2 family glycosyltransferase
MPKFNPLDHPICFSSPLRLATTSRVGHIPFALTLIDLLRPSVVVELGTFHGALYCAFCQAVKELKLSTLCYAIDTWQGDEQAGFYGPEVFKNLKEHHDPLYGGFSSLTESTFDDALSRFQDGAIDLLHIDGYHTYEVVRRDFENWLPKMSNRGSILFHDINVRERDFGVWKLWDEVKAIYPHFEFGHGHGLGVLATGASVPDRLQSLLEASAEEASLVRELFNQLGERLRVRLDKELEIETLSRQIDVEEEQIKTLSTKLALNEKELEAKRQTLNEVSAELASKGTQLNNILHSRAWRWVNRYGRAKNRYLLPVYRLIRPTRNGSRSGQIPANQYEQWVKEYDILTDSDRQAIRARIEELEYRPLISVVMPVYNVDEKWLRSAIESVRRQLYQNWELCIADDCSSRPHVRMVLKEYAEKDPRIKAVFRQQNGHIAAASNSALELAAGEFVAFLDNDDELSEHALYMVAEELNAQPEADLIYSDEDKINEQGKRFSPHFKTDWNPDLFYSLNFISHLGVYRTSILRKLGGFRSGYEGSQDYDLALRVVEQIPEDHILHIPHILYHWRAIPGSVASNPDEKKFAHEAARKAIRSHFERTGNAATITAGHNNYHRATYPLPTPQPLVSLIIGTRDRVELLRQVIEGILEQTDYQRIELLIIDNQSREPATLSYLDEIQKHAQVRVIPYDAPFNFSAINNLAVGQSQGEIIGLLNNDIKIISSGWLIEMVSHALRPEIGAVGAKLYYADDTIQHAGVILGVGGVAGHLYKHLPKEANGYYSRPHVIQNFSAVTGACLLMRRQIFDEVGGFDEVNLPVAFNDIDFCLRIRKRGYRILWTPYAELYHLESASRGSDKTPEKLFRFQRECAFMHSLWGDALLNDPYYNPNLSLHAEDCSLAVPPRTVKPWKSQGVIHSLSEIKSGNYSR